MFGNIGRGVKSPTFTERFGGTGFADPESQHQSGTGEVGRRRRGGDVRRSALARDRVTYFRNDFTDQISYRFGPTGDGIPEYINIDGSKASGLELEVALQRPLARHHGGGDLLVRRYARSSRTRAQPAVPARPAAAAAAATFRLDSVRRTRAAAPP